MSDLHLGSILFGVGIAPALAVATWLLFPTDRDGGFQSSTPDARGIPRAMYRWPWWSPVQLHWAWGVYAILRVTELIGVAWRADRGTALQIGGPFLAGPGYPTATGWTTRRIGPLMLHTPPVAG